MTDLGSGGTDMKDADMTEIIEYVEDELGFVTSYYENSYLHRRISSRMRRTGQDDPDEYLERLKTDEEEQELLLDAFSVNVTSFFRNPEVWERVQDVIRQLTQNNTDVKLWSAACSDGREAYSMAMLALDDPETDASRISIKATDIDPEILREAKEGVYKNTRTVDIDDELSFLDDYSDYIERDGDDFRVRDRVKRIVDFERHDLISDEPKSGFDLTVCRNLFIYINSDYKLPILKTVRDSLRPNGYLVIGKTETLPFELKSEFDSVDDRLRIYRLK